MRRALVCLIAGIAVLSRGVAPVAAQAAADAQAPAAAQAGPIVVELLPAPGTDEAVSNYERVVRDAIQVVLERRGYQVVLEPAGAAPDSGIRLRYEYALVGFLPRLHVIVTVRDALGGTRIAGALTAARGNITLYNSVDGLLDTLDPAVERYLARRTTGESAPEPIALVEELVLSELALLTPGLSYQERTYGAALPGTGEFELARDAMLPVRVSREGYYPQELLLPITGAQPELPAVTLRRQRRYGVQLHYGYPRLLGANLGVRYYAVPDRVYLGLENGIYMSGFFDTTPSQLLHLEPRLVAGFLPLGAQDRFIQPMVSSGVGLVATFLSYGDEPVPPYFDWYWNVINGGAEFGRRFARLYLRMGISYYFETDRGLWDTGINPSRLSPETVLGTVLRW